MRSEEKKNFGDSNHKCTKQNLILFAKYIKGELTRKEELTLDRHIQNCDDCFASFAYIENILTNKETLSIDEKTLLLKYLADPIWKNTIENAKEEILTEAKFLLSSPLENKLNLTNKETNASIATENKSIHKTRSSAKPKITYQKAFLVAATFALVLLPLSISLITFYKQSENVAVLDSTNGTILGNKTLNRDLYKDLDNSIDLYLSSKDAKHLKEAKKIAKELKENYKENYGIDLVSYYESAPSSKMEQLSNDRKKLFDLINKPPGDKYEEKIKASLELEKSFLALDNKVEAYRAKTLTNKFYLFLYNIEDFKTTSKEGLEFSTQNNYLLLKGYFLLWKAKYLSEETPFQKAEKVFQRAIEIGQQINVNELISSSNISLVTLYHINNDDQKCLDTIKSILSNPKDLKKERIISFLQIAGLAAINLKQLDESEELLEKSLTLARENKMPLLLAKSYTFLSLLSAEKADFAQRDYYYQQANEAINKVESPKTRLEYQLICLGYYAKTKLAERDFAQAAKAYEQSLSVAKKLERVNDIQLSQLNEGLAMASQELKNYKEADKRFAAAKHYANLAKNSKEKTNCLLSFVPNPC